ncbi:hypothetical protein LLG39_08470 [bacterium]|nr:hypothetical protein [bacterium]
MNAWWFTRLDIERMPGCDRFTLDGLSSGINIISGPNASGKSTTARAITGLLWPSKAGSEDEATASFYLDGCECRVVLHKRRGSYIIGGTEEASCPHTVPEERMQAYTLALPDLINSDNAEFARAIHQAASGGYDLDSAAAALQYRSDPYKPTNHKNELKKHSDTVETIRKAEGELNNRESSLERLRARRAQADMAISQLKILNEALECAARSAEMLDAEAALDRFDARMDNLLPNDAETLQRLKTQHAELFKKKSEAVDAFHSARRQLNSCALPIGGVPGSHINELNSHHAEWQRLAMQLKQEQSNLASVEGRQRNALQSIADEIDESRLSSIVDSPEVVQELLDYAQEATQLNADYDAQSAVKSWVGDTDTSTNLYKARDALFLLMQWLSRPESTTRQHGIHWLVASACGGAACLGVALALLVNPGLCVISLISVAIMLIFLMRRGSSKPGERESIKLSFTELPVQGPKTWTEDSVRERITELQTLCTKLERFTYWQSLDPKLRELDECKKALDQRARDLLARFGIAPSIDRVDLIIFAEAINRWLAAGDEAEGQRERCKRIEQDAFTCKNAINEILARYNIDPADNPAAALATIRDLDQRKQAFDKARSDIRRAVAVIGEARKGIFRSDTERDAFYNRIGTVVDDEVTVTNLLTDLAAFTTAKETLRNRQAVLASCERRLSDTASLFSDAAIDWYQSNTNSASDNISQIISLLRISPASDIQSQIDNLQIIANQRSDAHDAILKIETEVEMERQSCDLANAISDLETCRDVLRNERSKGYAAAAGWALADYVKREAERASLPAVFNRAGELFAEITNNDYKLDFDHRKVAFRAVDTRRNRSLTLDELSSGTRIQLLLAVRVAFVEQQEQGVKLPIILDETLATSDDDRADKIIQAVTALTRTGRQVFYFTAQPHEVEKWRSHLSECGAGFHCADMSEIRQLN